MTDKAMLVYRQSLRAFLEIVLALKNTPEGNGTLLDSTTLVWISDMAHHDHPVTPPYFTLMAGGGGFRADGKREIATGRYIKLASTKSGTPSPVRGRPTTSALPSRTRRVSPAPWTTRG